MQIGGSMGRLLWFSFPLCRTYTMYFIWNSEIWRHSRFFFLQVWFNKNFVPSVFQGYSYVAPSILFSKNQITHDMFKVPGDKRPDEKHISLASQFSVSETGARMECLVWTIYSRNQWSTVKVVHVYNRCQWQYLHSEKDRQILWNQSCDKHCLFIKKGPLSLTHQAMPSAIMLHLYVSNHW